ncbi:MAG: VOC family protein [Planctomycetales bacterium]|nr:VOC family protein [bacterium]UNM08079.1 MAG: VOC family protein [Planctomycetales bacterium]
MPVASPSPVLFILYVSDQQRSCDFYRKALELEPELDVPGMTEFRLNSGAMLGLMPEAGIARIIGDDPAPASGNGIPRAELYLSVDDPGAAIGRAIEAGAVMLSVLQPRNWGDIAGYVRDPDGHVLAFASCSVSLTQ